MTSSSTVEPATARHPLEPLSAAEIRVVVAALKADPRVNLTTRFVSVSLEAPEKARVHAGDPSIPRMARAVLFDNAANACHEALVALEDARVIAWTHVPGVQPTMTIDEQVECERAVLASPEFRAKLEEHTGVVDTGLVMVDIWSAGYYGEAEEGAMRLARPLCFLRADPTDNGYVRPIEGLRPVVDLNTMRVLRVEDHGRWPVPADSANYAAGRLDRFRADIKPLEIAQPEGPGFEVAGNAITWQNWSFVVGFDAREGLSMNHLRYQDRSILYRGSLSEMVVPYGDPGPTQRRKNAFDVGEYGMGMCANSLVLGCDCLGAIRYLDAHLVDSRGGPVTIKNAVCLHEEDHGILWKHTDRRLPDAPEVRRSRRLVVSSVSTVENYEYGFFWYLYQDGSIQFEVKLTGILSMGAAHPGESPPHGSLIAPQVYAPNHQHFFNMRLDFDLDGMENTAERVDVVADPIGGSNPFENAFRAVATPLKSEAEARGNLCLESARTWKIVNPSRLNAVGQPVGYKLLPGDNSVPYASKNAWWRRRAGFVDHHVWVTPYRPDERYAAGDHPNQSHGGEGLPRWTAQDRPIADTDIVLWYTFGHTHIPRPEDSPVMPSAYIGFLLKPAGFFDANPANDVPPSGKPTGEGCCGGSTLPAGDA